jgi:uncharacterized membrane protein YagU involved in acid resistance
MRHERAIDWRAGLWAGLIAGVIDELLLWTLMLMQGMSPLAGAPMGAAVLLGPGVLQAPPTAGIVAASLLVHFALSILYGLMIAALVGPASRGSGLLLGLAFGLVIWFVNYFVIAPAAFPWFVPLRSSPMSPFLHAAFGVIAAGAYLALRYRERRCGVDRRIRLRAVIVERRGFDDRRHVLAG